MYCSRWTLYAGVTLVPPIVVSHRTIHILTNARSHEIDAAGSEQHLVSSSRSRVLSSGRTLFRHDATISGQLGNHENRGKEYGATVSLCFRAFRATVNKDHSPSGHARAYGEARRRTRQRAKHGAAGVRSSACACVRHGNSASGHAPRFPREGNLLRSVRQTWSRISSPYSRLERTVRSGGLDAACMSVAYLQRHHLKHGTACLARRSGQLPLRLFGPYSTSSAKYCCQSFCRIQLRCHPRQFSHS